MNRYLFLKLAWRYLKEYAAAPFVSARLHRKYPTCRFHPGVSIDRTSSLGRYNVIFKNAAIINSSIGDHTYIQKESLINEADIGKFCSIAMNVSIGLAQHATTYVSSHPAFYLLNTPLVKTFSTEDIFLTTSRTIIGHDVWIGQNALIMSGVKIGTGAVIGAGSVVTKDVPEYAIVTGIPANISKFRFEENIRRDLLQTKWWNMPNEWIEKNCLLFTNPLQLIDILKKCNG